VCCGDVRACVLPDHGNRILRARAAFTLLELTVAAIVLMVLWIVSLQVFAALERQQRAAETHAWAVQTAANVLEQFTAQGYAGVTPAAASNYALPPAEEAARSSARLKLHVFEVQDEPPAKHIVLMLDWNRGAGLRAEPIRLSAWVYRDALPRENAPSGEE
jgi:Tfp pilus assembly protein PilE